MSYSFTTTEFTIITSSTNSNSFHNTTNHESIRIRWFNCYCYYLRYCFQFIYSSNNPMSTRMFTQFINLVSVIILIFIRYPFHYLYSTLSDFILHFPIQTRSSLIPSLLQLLSFLHSMDAVTDIFCKNWIIQCLSSLPLSESSSTLTEATPQLYPISFQASSSIIVLIEECSKLLFEVINHDEQQFYLFLTVMNFISVDQEFTAKRVHQDYSVLSFEVIFLFFLIINRYKILFLIIHSIFYYFFIINVLFI